MALWLEAEYKVMEAFDKLGLEGVLKDVHVERVMDNNVLVRARLEGLSGGNYSVTVSVPVYDGELLFPAVFTVNGHDKFTNVHLFSKGEFDKLLMKVNRYEKMHGSWATSWADDSVSNEEYVVVHPGMYYVANLLKVYNEANSHDKQGYKVFIDKMFFGIKKEAKTPLYFDTDLEDAIKVAIDQKRRVRFYYWADVGTSAIRRVEPHYLWEDKSGDIFLIGWDEDRSNWRMYNLGRIRDLQIILGGYYKETDSFMHTWEESKTQGVDEPEGTIWTDIFDPSGFMSDYVQVVRRK